MASKMFHMWNVKERLDIKLVVFTAILTLSIFSNVESQETERTILMEQQLENVKKSQYMREGSVDRFEDLALTPYWDLAMAEGETVQVDCGVYTEGESGVDVHWILPDGTIKDVNDTNDRISLVMSDRNPQATKKAAYTVLTLTIHNLTRADQGSYTCHAEKQSANNKITTQRSIQITVSSADILCGFESPTLCGWKDTHAEDDNTTVAWRYHNADDPRTIEMTKLRNDHTYGPSKHQGHMLSVDTSRDSIERGSTLGLMSPEQLPHNGKKCFEFWHICSGNVDDFIITLHYPLNTSLVNDTLILHTNHEEREWHLDRVTIPAQAISYQILLEVRLCEQEACKAMIALDDFRLSPKPCDEFDPLEEDKSLQVRLVNGTSATDGRLEILHDGKWGTICSENFGRNDSRVACRMLGLSPAEDVAFDRNAGFGRDEQPDSNSEYMIWLEKLACSGDEQSLGSCISKGKTWGDHQCTHARDIAVFCSDKPSSVPTTKKPVIVETSSKKMEVPTPRPTVPTARPTTTKPPSPTKRSSTASSTRSTTASPRPVVTDQPKLTTTDSHLTEEGGSTTGQSLTHSGGSDSHAGAAVGIIVALVIIALVSGVYCYKKKKHGHKSKYIVFSNPKYHKDSLPGNDISMDSPLTSSSLSILT